MSEPYRPRDPFAAQRMLDNAYDFDVRKRKKRAALGGAALEVVGAGTALDGLEIIHGVTQAVGMEFIPDHIPFHAILPFIPEIPNGISSGETAVGLGLMVLGVAVALLGKRRPLRRIV